MARIDFYHLQKQTLDEVLPKLLKKTYDLGHKVLVKVGTPERVEFINSALWTFADESFLPHGSKKDGCAAQQPIWLTSDDDNPNKADFLFLVDGAEAEADYIKNFVRIFDIFDGNSEQAVLQARHLWKTSKETGYDVYYWQQNSDGKWEQKA